MALTKIFSDINDAYTEMQLIRPIFAKPEKTRNGEAWTFGMPVVVTHTNPEHRVLFDPIRDANPFFHFMEAIWMFSGSDLVKFPGYFAKNILNYSDDGVTLNGAYGHRWRHHFEIDQINEVIEILTKEPNSRRAVIAMWDPQVDTEQRSLDLPCNTHIYFRNMGGKLSMTVCNRSNDLVWGMLGANFVHMGFLHEYIANAVKLRLGDLIQFTNNLHIYEGWEDKFARASDNWYSKNLSYPSIKWSPLTLYQEEALEFTMQGENSFYACPVLKHNAFPMLRSWNAYKLGDFIAAQEYASDIHDGDWREACTRWLKRREQGRVETQEG